jgi:hypothetical protein
MRKFREKRRAALRSEWKGWLFVAVAVGCGVWLALGDGWGRVTGGFPLGVVLTALMFGWMLGFDARSLRWAWGAYGEQWTAEELAKLDSANSSVFHDLPDWQGNGDHVVVGPPGVFVIDSKNLSEPASVDERGLRSGRLRFGGSASLSSAVRMKAAHRAAGWHLGVGAVGRRDLGRVPPLRISGRRRPSARAPAVGSRLPDVVRAAAPCGARRRRDPSVRSAFP